MTWAVIMKTSTLEMGLPLWAHAPDFALYDHKGHVVEYSSLMGERGLILGFTGDIWEPASVRRILWLQRHQQQFQKQGVNLGLLVCDKPYKLNGFSMSSLVPLEFPLLSDADRNVHAQYNMEPFAGLILIDHQWSIREKWIMPDERVWPKIGDLLSTIQML
jgi:peroxiredoxin